MANVLVEDNGRHFSPTSANLRTNHQWNYYDGQSTELCGLSCGQNNNQRLYEDMILIDDELLCEIFKVIEMLHSS